MNNDIKSLNIFDAASVLQYIDLKTILNADNLKLLSPYSQYHLLQLLPPCELRTTHNGELKYLFDCLKNEYISQAMMDWQDKFSEGVVINTIFTDCQASNDISNTNCNEMKPAVNERNPLKRMNTDAKSFCTISSQTKLQNSIVENELTNIKDSPDHCSNIKRRRSSANSSVMILNDKSAPMQLDSKLMKARVILQRVMLKRYDIYEDNIYSVV